MTKESRYIKKCNENAAPLAKKSKVLKWTGTGILAVCSIGCIGMMFVNVAIAIVIVMLGILVAAICEVKSLQYDFKYTIAGDALLKDSMETQELDDFEVDEFDQIMDEMEQGISTYQFGGTMLTFTPNLIVSKGGYVDFCRVSDICRVVHYSSKNEYSFDFDGKRGSSFSIDYLISEFPDEKEKILDLIAKHYPDFELVQMSEEEWYKIAEERDAARKNSDNSSDSDLTGVSGDKNNV